MSCYCVGMGASIASVDGESGVVVGASGVASMFVVASCVGHPVEAHGDPYEHPNIVSTAAPTTVATTVGPSRGESRAQNGQVSALVRMCRWHDGH